MAQLRVAGLWLAISGPPANQGPVTFSLAEQNKTGWARKKKRIRSLMFRREKKGRTNANYPGTVSPRNSPSSRQVRRASIGPQRSTRPLVVSNARKADYLNRTKKNRQEKQAEIGGVKSKEKKSKEKQRKGEERSGKKKKTNCSRWWWASYSAHLGD